MGTVCFCPLVNGKGEELGPQSHGLSRLACVYTFFRTSNLSQAFYLALDFQTSERQDY